MSAKAHAVLYAINEKEHNLVTIIRSKITNFEKINNLDFIKTILENSILKNIHSLTFLFEKDLASWPIYISNKPTIAKFKNVFYLGDAFHTLPPTMAQGASQSIEGAMELFKIFEKDINDKQNLYFNTRLNRTEKINKRSNFNYFVFHLSNKFFVRFRNILIKRLINNKKFIKNYLGRVFRK